MDNEHNPGTPEWYAAMDRLGRKYTGWDPLEQMCTNIPTLRRLKRMSIEEQDAICRLRDAYKYVNNGKVPFPKKQTGA
ncbi:MAG: hypothetical protein M0R30_03095 [Methanoregula sp.]|uniref:hypothetical protein n=1 Tax=Methanoregula sp. TaxID=2052170 RepID=UPI0025E7A782|nr:hypothetical protein [Methanoregula sp.]MCK9630607.1 hypothetical protein [Methanoregula sp.]